MPKRARRGQTAKSVLASDDPDDDDGSYFSVDDRTSFCKVQEWHQQFWMMLDESANMWLMIAEHVAPDLKVDYCKAAHMIPSLPLPPLFSSPPLQCRVMTAKCSIHVMGVGGGDV